ncbi:gallate 1-beta-glucosyltransferase 84A24-like [Phragmites australis]|uniref:gallate 1-beta-glucosyltransferase 84A24-like n=1 Tax=Phragmites australis TaxID=29695 RepID=UPI002D7941F6|nr:gallate 1-beta-glucosyltransferase 84A24-like [Phragmites australis]
MEPTQSCSLAADARRRSRRVRVRSLRRSGKKEAPSPAMSSPPTPHVLLVSAPLQGHVNPLLVLGRRLASRGLLVTFTTAPHTGLKKVGHENGAALDSVRRGAVRFEHLSGGGLWAPDDPRYRVPDDVARHLEDAAPAALAGLIRRQADAGRPVSCIVANAFAPWALRAAGAMGVPCAMLWTQSCAVLSLYYHYFHLLAAFTSEEAEADTQVSVPGLPPLAAGDLPSLIHAPEDYIWRQTLVADIRSLRETASWVLVNTFDELEHAAIEALRAHLPVVSIGPLFETENDAGHDECTAWLDAQTTRSVVFVAFGSVLKLSRDEMADLSEGLADTGRPFLWVVRDDSRDLLPDNALAAATSGGGRVVSWCKQRRVLSHRAVGCFVTHCGWNSTTEALVAGVPVVAYPAWSDQRTNAAFLVDVYGVGVRLVPTPPTRDAVRRCVEEVMSGAPEAEVMRARAEEWKAKASAAVADGGSSDRGTRDFVDAVLSIGAGN